MLPYIILHTGVSLDGRMDYGCGENSPYYALLEHIQADLDLSGSNTILAAQMADDPQAAMPELYALWSSKPNRPRLAVIDSQGRVKCWPAILKQPFWSGYFCLCSQRTPADHVEWLRSLGVEVIITGEQQVDLRRALEVLGEQCSVRRVRIDSGGILNGVLLRAGLGDEIHVVIGPGLVGGSSPKSMFVAPDLSSAAGVIPLKCLHVEQLNGDHVWLRYQILHPNIGG